jgi:type IV secretory pathway component VirB8
MNFEEQNKSAEHELTDMQVDTALRHFRESVKAWSEAEYSKPRSVRQTQRSNSWSVITSPLLGWSLAAAVVATTVAVPVAVHHQHVIEVQKHEAVVRQQQLDQEKAAQARAAAIDDDELLSHVDSDIAQDAPDAMQPLSKLMNTSNQ